MTTILLGLLLGALNFGCVVNIGAVPLPPLSAPQGGEGVVLDGLGHETVWDANSQPIIVDPAVANVTVRRATLRGALLLAPMLSAPLALNTSQFKGPWYLEDVLIYTSTCEELDAFASLACDVQPAAWISSNGRSVSIASFSGGGFTSTNVTLTCDLPTTSSSSSSPVQAVRRPACVTLIASSSAQLLALMLYNATQYSAAAAIPVTLPLSPSRLHISLTANISLDLAAWAAAHPVVTRPLTTISAADCRRVTAVDLRGGIALMTAKGGGILRFLCLELSNLATDTLGNSMPRGLLSGAVWAVDVEVPLGSRLVVENSTLVLTKDEFKWQSYYMAQALQNSVVLGSVTSVLASFQGVVSPSQLLWVNVSSPHTRWRNVILTSLPQVYETIVPNSFIMRYLGLSIYLTDLRMVYTCEELLRAVYNGSDAVSGAAAAGAPPSPRVLVLGANISIGPCWPKTTPVEVAGPSLMIMGLPDVTTSLDLAGRSDAFELGSGSSVSFRFLTLLGLSMHEDADSDDEEPTSALGSTPTASAPAVTPDPGDTLTCATALLWAFHFVRRTVQLQLESVSVVVPAMEMEQYDRILKGQGPAMPCFSTLSVYLGASSLAAVQPAVANSASSPGAPPSVLAARSFDSLLLPGIRGTDVAFSVWSGQYGNWSRSMYDVDDSAGAGGKSGGGLDGWRVGLLAAAGATVVLGAFAGAMLYIQRYRAAASAAAAASTVASKRRGDIEACDGDGRTSVAVLSVVASGGQRPAAAVVAPRRPLYDSFDDPAFELDLVRGAKLSPDDVADILERVNAEAAEFNIQMTEICGSGAFGVVYGGMWHGLKVAIKTMVFSETAPPLLGGQLARQQCIREAAFCCTMHHPNVVATHHYYLKSAKRHTMFDDILQQMDDNSSDEGDRRRRRTPPPPPAAEALSPSLRRQLAAPSDAAAVAEEGRPTEKLASSDRNTSAAAASPAASPAAPAASGIAPGLLIGPRRNPGKSVLPRFRLHRSKAAVTDWRLYLIQEYCDGGTLRQAVDEGKLFRHSGIQRTVAGRAAVGGRAAAGGGGAAAATPDGARPTAGANINGQLPTDSLDGVQTLMIIGKQGQVTYDRFVAPVGTGDAAAGEAAGANAAGAAGGEAAVSDVAGVVAAAAVKDADDLISPIDALAPLLVDQAAGEAQSEAAAASPARRPKPVLCLRRHTTITIDSNFIGTTLTNATVDSTILASTNCSDAGDVQPPPLTPVRPSPAAPVPPPPPTLLTPAAPALALPEEPLPADFALVIHTALGIASGVAYLHSRNIIHGDLSANNVLLMKTKMEGVPVLAKLSDFGLSMRLEQGQDHLKDIHHGTPYYQSPEVAEHGTCSLAADVYSLGVLLWELYHGQPPWRAKRHKVRKPLRTPSDGDPAAPAAVAAAAAAARRQAAAVAAAADAATAADADLWDDPHYQLRACDVLIIAPTCPASYARVLRRCLSPDPQSRPSARAVVKSLLRMERSLAAAAAAAGDRECMAGAPVGAMMALTRPAMHATAVPGRMQDAALLLEDFDAAAAAVAAAVARVTAAPTVAGAPASAGAAAAVAAAAAAGAASGSLLPVIDSSAQLVAATPAARAAAAAPRQRPPAPAAFKVKPGAPAASLAASAATATATATPTATATGNPSTPVAATAAERDAHVETLE